MNLTASIATTESTSITTSSSTMTAAPAPAAASVYGQPKTLSKSQVTMNCFQNIQLFYFLDS